jgi:serine/threonine protein kinase
VVGCLIAELLSRKPLFPGKDEVEQTDLIFQMLGSPNERVWPKWRELPQARNIPEGIKYPPRLSLNLRKNNVVVEAADLIQKLLALDPAKRLTAGEALDHEWFRMEPLACAKSELPKFEESTHEFQAKRRRQAAAAFRDVDSDKQKV